MVSERFVLDVSVAAAWCFRNEANADSTALLESLRHRIVGGVRVIWQPMIGCAPQEACPGLRSGQALGPAFGRTRGRHLAFSAFSARSAVNPCRGSILPRPPTDG